MKQLILLMMIGLSLCSCGRKNDGQSIIGKWKSTGAEEETMIFHENGTLEYASKDGKHAPWDGQDNVRITWKTVIEVEPHQLYLAYSDGEKSGRVPLGIYKIENNKLIIRQCREIHRTLGGIDMGVIRHEISEDFSGPLNILERID